MEKFALQVSIGPGFDWTSFHDCQLYRCGVAKCDVTCDLPNAKRESFQAPYFRHESANFAFEINFFGLHAKLGCFVKTLQCCQIYLPHFENP